MCRYKRSMKFRRVKGLVRNWLRVNRLESHTV